MPAFSSKKQVNLDFADKTKFLSYFSWAFYLLVVYHCYFFVASYFGS